MVLARALPKQMSCNLFVHGGQTRGQPSKVIPSKGYLRTQVFLRVTCELKYFLSNWYQSKFWDQWKADFKKFLRREIADFEFLNSNSEFSNPGTMVAKKVNALEERLEGEMNQIKTTVEERMSSMEGQVADLRDMIKKMLEVHNQTTASVARNGEGRSTNSEIRREEEEAEIVEGERRRPHLEPDFFHCGLRKFASRPPPALDFYGRSFNGIMFRGKFWKADGFVDKTLPRDFAFILRGLYDLSSGFL
ncbi:hypothetical protein M5K25_000676 [Dendrobium thyrsiflorum]|uniref:Uncharacterized protein n=1 Tax=Dendrobium thyrsiflorum TaxID=117978 RepID=A0ABD0VUW5_DENTH